MSAYAPSYSLPAPVPCTVCPYTVYYEYYEPDYVIVDGVYVYSDGSTVVTEDREPDWIELDGTRVYDLTDEEDREPDWIELDGTRVYDMTDEPDYILFDLF